MTSGLHPGRLRGRASLGGVAGISVALALALSGCGDVGSPEAALQASGAAHPHSQSVDPAPSAAENSRRSEETHEPLAEKAPCTGISVRCGAAPSLRFDDRGRLWAAFEQEGLVWVAVSSDRGT
ncbi:MAG: hypothetical protein KDD47_26075, partial [Acidobacteria bacterium]|nr:hypothetical protein [Acidobacteriota bacterium]